MAVAENMVTLEVAVRKGAFLVSAPLVERREGAFVEPRDCQVEVPALPARIVPGPRSPDTPATVVHALTTWSVSSLRLACVTVPLATELLPRRLGVRRSSGPRRRGSA